jgi:nitroreductase
LKEDKMNKVLEAISKRRSVRSYESKPVPRDIVDILIKAANEAPSGMNSQPWRFVVIEDKEFKKKLVKAAIPNAKKYLEPYKETNPERYALIMKRYEELNDPVYYSAPVIIFVIGKGRQADNSCPLACQNMMLAAYSLGIGSCWVALGSHITDNAEIAQALELQADEKIFGPILIGYPKEYPKAPKKKGPVVKWI